MDKEAARQIVIEEAQRAGVDPAIALSVWEQEGGGSTDLGLRGPTLPKGKWKGHYARGPWQIMSFHGEIPQDFRGQTRWAMQHLKERGIRGYYGTGDPVVPGHPTTDQYEAQVLARAGRMASTTGSGPAVSPHALPDKWSLPQLPDQLPDTPMMDYSQPHPALQAILAQQQPSKPSVGDMLLAMGTGILSSGGGPGAGNWAAGGFRNVQNLLQRRPEELGALEYLQANASLWQLEQKNMERRQAKQEEKRQREYLESIAQNESLPDQVRFEAQNQLMGITGLDLPEPPKPPEVPSKIREAEALAARLGIPIEEAYARVGLGPETAEPQEDPVKIREAEALAQRLGIPLDEAFARVGLGPEIPEEDNLTEQQRLSYGNQVQNAFRSRTQKELLEPLRRWYDVQDKDPTTLKGAEQRTLIVNYAKMLDPTSAVMENEADAVAKAGEKNPQLRAWWRQYLDGNLPQETLVRIHNEMRHLARRRHLELQMAYQDFSHQLELAGIDNPTPFLGTLPEAPNDGGYYIADDGTIVPPPISVEEIDE